MSSSYRDTDLAGVVLGSYRIISEISSGGMGTVYRAQHTLLERTAAVKMLRPQLTENADFVERFFRQARAAAAIDARADLYSLGCILYELLVGEPPFVATGAGEIIAMHMFTPPQPPSQRACTSPEMEAIVMWLLDKDPRTRFQTAGEVAEALAAIGGFASAGHRMPVPPGAPLVDTPVPSPTEARRRSTVALVVGALTLAVAAIAAVVIATRPHEVPAGVEHVVQPPRIEVPRPKPVPVVPSEPIVVPDDPPKPPTKRVVRTELPVDAGAGRTTAVKASEVKIDTHTEQGSPMEHDIGELKNNHKPLDRPPPP